MRQFFFYNRIVVSIVFVALLSISSYFLWGLYPGVLLWSVGIFCVLIWVLMQWSKTFLIKEKNEKRLRNREIRYRQTLSTLPIGIVQMRPDWTVEWHNPKAKEFLVSIKTESNLLEHVDQAAFERYILDAVFEKPFLLNRADDKNFELKVLVPDEYHPILLIEDVTQRNQIEAMRRDFVGNVSHELRTPLTVIQGFLEIGQENPQTLLQKNNTALQMMFEQATRMKTLIDDLLLLSKLEVENSLESDQEDVIAMPTLVRDILEEARVLNKDRLTIHCKIDPVYLLGNVKEVRSALINLVSNAIRYTPEGGTIDIEWVAKEEGASFRVRDTGIGIAPEHIARLTERFFRVDKGRSRSNGGTGLGLAIVKHIVRRQGAELKIESQLGEGSTFSIDFPSQKVVH